MTDEAGKGGPTPQQLAALSELEERVQQWRDQALKGSPMRTRSLIRILRKSVETGRLNALARWCLKHGFHITKRELPSFRDFLITQSIHLKDLEPPARARLRVLTLKGQDPDERTHDYLDGQRRGEDMRCKDCRFFVRAPNDDPDDPDASKPCVAFGTKGDDIACFGFTRPPS